MIFLSVGTQLPFDRLIMAVDAWIGRNKVEEDVVAQIGPARYKPTFMAAHSFIPPDRFQDYLNNSRLLIAHAGMGAILSALESAKPLIIMPRVANLGEHRNDHQLATAKRFRGRPGIHVANDVEELNQLLERNRELCAPNKIIDAQSSELIDALTMFLKGRGARTQEKSEWQKLGSIST